MAALHVQKRHGLRPAEQIPLAEPAARRPYHVQVRLGLQPTGDDVHADPVPELDDGLDDRRGRPAPPGRLGEQCPVHLDQVDRQAAQVGQRS